MLTASLGTGARQAADSGMQGLMCAPDRAPLARHDLAGYGRMLAAMKFMRWAIEQDRFPSIELVQSHFNVCRATAYRWTRALAETYGLDPSTRHGGRHP